jgi:hypothetical protein
MVRCRFPGICTGIELDADIEIERQHRMEALKAELGVMAAQGNFANAIDKMMGIVLGLEQENERMSWRLLRVLRYRFGRNTEKLAPAELKQLYLAIGGDAAAPTPADGPLVPVPAAPAEVLNADGEVATPNGAGKKRRKRKVGGQGREEYHQGACARRGADLRTLRRRMTAEWRLNGLSTSKPAC